MSGTVLVTGATGVAGSEVVHALRRRGRRVRALVRDAGSARGRLGDAVELARGDFADPASVRTALHGVQDVLLSCADDPRRVGWETDAIDAAVAAGVTRIVKLSSIAAAPGSPVAFWDWHGRVEAHLRTAPVASTILRSGPFMSNLLASADGVAHTGRLFAPVGDARVAMIDPCDVGTAAAAVLAGDGAGDETHVLTGPEAVTYTEVAAALTMATGRPVTFTDIPDDAARQALVDAGVPKLAATQVVAIYAQLRQGAAERVTTTVETLTGTPPRDVAAFLADHASCFAPALAESGG